MRGLGTGRAGDWWRVGLLPGAGHSHTHVRSSVLPRCLGHSSSWPHFEAQAQCPAKAPRDPEVTRVQSEHLWGAQAPAPQTQRACPERPYLLFFCWNEGVKFESGARTQPGLLMP